jgi:predicted DNA-binding protein
MKSPKNETEKITLRLPTEMKNDLQLLADNEDRKLSDYIRVKLKALISQEKGEITKP